MNLQSLVASRLTGRPWAIAPGRLEGLLGGVATLTAGGDLPPWLQERSRRQDYTVTESGIAVVPIVGPLVARGDWLTALLGASEYAAVADALTAAAADPSVRGILLEVDSPGGAVGGLFDLVEEVASIRARCGKPLWAVASEAALSAAYAIASAADRLYVTRTGEVGSVGVVAAHLDESGADAMAGLSWTLIHAGARKTDGNPHEPLSPRATAAIQADVDHLYDALVALVAGNRGLGADAVRATEAAIYRGERAVTAKLADRLGGVSQAIADLQAALKTKRLRAGPPTNRPPDQVRGAVDQSRSLTRTLVMDASDPLSNASSAEPMEDAAGPTETPKALPANTLPHRPLPAPVPDAHAIAETLRAEFAEIATITAQAGRLGIDLDAADAMRRRLKPDALRQSVLDQLAARAETADVVAAARPSATAGDSPIVRRARERAAASNR